jgi:hypothetical protein
LLAIVLMGCSCATDLQGSPESEGLQPARSFQSSRFAAHAQGSPSIKCLPASSVVKRKDERRESVAATNHFLRTFLQDNSFASIAESFALSITRPERLFELSGTPPPAACC